MEALKQRQSGAVADNTKIIKVAEAEADDWMDEKHGRLVTENLFHLTQTS
jgi:hypothetical protein